MLLRPPGLLSCPYRTRAHTRGLINKATFPIRKATSETIRGQQGLGSSELWPLIFMEKRPREGAAAGSQLGEEAVRDAALGLFLVAAPESPPAGC